MKLLLRFALKCAKWGAIALVCLFAIGRSLDFYERKTDPKGYAERQAQNAADRQVQSGSETDKEATDKAVAERAELARYKVTPTESYEKGGKSWVMVVVEPRPTADALLRLARKLRAESPGIAFHIFDNAAKVHAYKQWTVHYPDERYPFPEKWAASHQMGMINRMLLPQGEAKWVLATASGETIASLE